MSHVCTRNPDSLGKKGVLALGDLCNKGQVSLHHTAGGLQRQTLPGSHSLGIPDSGLCQLSCGANSEEITMIANICRVLSLCLALLKVVYYALFF